MWLPDCDGAVGGGLWRLPLLLLRLGALCHSGGARGARLAGGESALGRLGRGWTGQGGRGAGGTGCAEELCKSPGNPRNSRIAPQLTRPRVEMPDCGRGGVLSGRLNPEKGGPEGWRRCSAALPGPGGGQAAAVVSPTPPHNHRTNVPIRTPIRGSASGVFGRSRVERRPGKEGRVGWGGGTARRGEGKDSPTLPAKAASGPDATPQVL